MYNPPKERKKTCCFTGHRPKDLPFPMEETHAGYQRVYKALERKVFEAIGDGYSCFISGMAQGIDLMAACIVLHLRDTRYPFLTLECALPHLGQTIGWGFKDIALYEKVLSMANEVTYVSKKSERGTFMKRNRYMVDHSARVIGVYNGSSTGGTKNTLVYAVSQGIEICVVDLPLSA